MAITAAMVKALRDKTGLPMMDCKKALTENGGDEAKAIEWLRQKGLGQVSKRAARETSEGRVVCHTNADNGRTAIVELQCETAPVANTDDFVKLAGEIARHATLLESPTAETVLAQAYIDDSSRTLQDYMNDAVNRIRENIKVANVHCFDGHVGQYIHHDGRVGVMIELSGDCPDNVKADVCMHIAAMQPEFRHRDEVDKELVEQERKIAAEQAKGKPEAIIDKIVDGKINRWFSEIVLLEQPFVKDDKQSVGQMLGTVAPELTVKRYVRCSVGG
jgi:elongation factor Ts